MPSSPETVPGLDLDRLGAWLSRTVPGAGSRLSAHLIAGGKSNLTYIVTDGEQEWVVRRPPLGHVLATAHDMAREYRVITALRDTEVPVPATFAFCDDLDVAGAPFYVMERVVGVPYRADAELTVLGPRRTRLISTRLVDTLALLHDVDPDAIGLGDFGRPDGYLIRQVERWKKQLDASSSRELPTADELHTRLTAAAPAESGVSVVHGDFRLDNVLVDDRDRLTAVLDWEMATLGDPLLDLGLMLVHHRFGQLVGDVVATAAQAPGFLTEPEIIDRYTTVTGRDLTRLGFYLALSAYKLAAILEGVHYRYIQGQTVGGGFERIGDSIPVLLDMGLRALKENS